MPTLIFGNAVFGCRLPFSFWDAGGAIVRNKDDVGRTPDRVNIIRY